MSSEVPDVIPSALRGLVSIREMVKDEKKKCVRFLLDLNPDVLTIHGELHGGYISMATLVAAEIAATTLLSNGEMALVAINHHVNFLKHVEAFEEVEMESCVVSKGERLVYIETSIRCGDEVARSITSFIVERI